MKTKRGKSHNGTGREANLLFFNAERNAKAKRLGHTNSRCGDKGKDRDSVGSAGV